jgi:hypothetical protein
VKVGSAIWLRRWLSLVRASHATVATNGLAISIRSLQVRFNNSRWEVGALSLLLTALLDLGIAKKCQVWHCRIYSKSNSPQKQMFKLHHEISMIHLSMIDCLIHSAKEVVVFIYSSGTLFAIPIIGVMHQQPTGTLAHQ